MTQSSLIRNVDDARNVFPLLTAADADDESTTTDDDDDADDDDARALAVHKLPQTSVKR